MRGSGSTKEASCCLCYSFKHLVLAVFAASGSGSRAVLLCVQVAVTNSDSLLEL
jgi:hypothetical protein